MLGRHDVAEFFGYRFGRSLYLPAFGKFGIVWDFIIHNLPLCGFTTSAIGICNHHSANFANYKSGEKNEHFGFCPPNVAHALK